MAHSFTVARSVTNSLRQQVVYQREDADEVKARQLEDSYLAALRYIRENPMLGLSIKQMPSKFRRVQLALFQYYLYYIYDESADDVFVFALRHKRQWNEPNVIRGIAEEVEREEREG